MFLVLCVSGPPCPAFHFDCGDGLCRPIASLCDDIRDCPGGEDERFCGVWPGIFSEDSVHRNKARCRVLRGILYNSLRENNKLTRGESGCRSVHSF